MVDGALELTIGRGIRSRRLFILAISAFSLVALVASISLISIRVALAVVGALTVSIWIFIYCARRQFDRVAMAWMVVFPFCYYLFSYPRERAVFTVDRAFVLLVLLTLISTARDQRLLPLGSNLRSAGYYWAAYLSVSLISLLAHPAPDILSSYRLFIDGMVMPALLGLYAVRFFPIVQNLSRVHACVCVLMIGVALVAGTELISGTNLFPSPGAVETWVQTSDARFIRVDGPFENSSVLCVVGTVGFFFIVYTGRVLGGSLTGSQRSLHSAGILAALASALMPMNRGLLIALLVCACIDYFAAEPLVSRRIWNCILLVLLFFTVIGKVFYPGVYEDRVTSQANFYQRIAQNLQTLQVIRDHPLIGVGFGLYHDAVLEDSKYQVGWGGFEPMNAPHNSLSAVLAEEGCLGFVLYIAAQLFFVRAMYELRKFNKLGWRAFLYCILVYTIFGLDVGIGYYSDLNLFYMFVLGIILQIQLRTLPREPSHAIRYL